MSCVLCPEYEWTSDRERVIHYLKIETALDWKEITHHFRRWGQRNETWIASNCGISSCFDLLHVTSWFLFARPIVLSIHMPAFYTFSRFLRHLFVCEHLLEVWSGACLYPWTIQGTHRLTRLPLWACRQGEMLACNSAHVARQRTEEGMWTFWQPS